LLDNVDIPNHINHMAGRAVISQLDTSDLHNIIWTYDSQVQRWASLTWDLDMSDWSRVPQISPYDQMGRGQTEFLFVQSPIQQDPDLRSMYMRRLRTLYDQLIANEAIKNKFNEFQAAQNDVMADDLVKWPQAYQWGSTTDMFNRISQSEYIGQVHNGLDEKRRIWHSFQRIQLGIPDSQTNAERQQVTISSIVPHVDDANEHIVLTNNADTAVDVSGWTLQQIDLTLKAGTVIPAGKSIHLVMSDIGYRANHPSVVIAAQYATDLGNSGTLTLTTNTNSTIETKGY
jgi:hypothetical protein